MTSTVDDTTDAARTLPLLQTKLFVPRSSPGIIPRPRIFERLDEGIRRKLILASAPAGSGKTTLVSEWIALRDIPTAWISLDGTDNDPVRFWSYVTTALGRIAPHLGESVPALLRASSPIGIEGILTELINDLSLIETQILLVLDDYHVISNDAIHRGVAFLLEHLPPSLRLAITSRIDPPLPLGRLRAGGQLTEIRADDLRFTLPEATAFLKDVMELNLTPDEVMALEQKTEGWVAGIQLAALSMQGRKNPGSFIEAFTGSHRYVVDYLTEEVLRNLPERLRTFLLNTSVLDRLTSSLCDAVTDRQDAAEMLRRVEEMNLFIIPLDEHRHWYRYHNLLADVLRHRLEQTQPEVIGELHRRASGWYESHGMVDQAVGHSLAAKDFERAIDLFETTAEEIVARSEMTTLRTWVQAIPDKLLRTHPRLSLLYAWTLISVNQDDEKVEDLLLNVEQSLANTEENAPSEASEERELRGILEAIRAYQAISSGDVDTADQLARGAMKNLPEWKPFWRASIAMSMGAICSLKGDIHGAITWFAEAASMGKASGNAYTALVASYNLAGLLESCGELRQAERTYREALEWVEGHGARRLAVMGTIYEGLARLLTQRNELDEALNYVERSLTLGKRRSDLSIIRAAYITMAAIRHARGEIDAAHDAIDEARSIEREHSHPHWSEWAELVRARMALSEGNVAIASAWARAFETEIDGGNPNRRRLNQILMVIRVYIAEGRYEQALDELEELYESAIESNREKRAVEILALKALALDALGRTDEALPPVRHALALAEQEGYLRVFIEEGAPMARLLRRVADHPEIGNKNNRFSTRFVRELLRSIEPEEGPTAQGPTQRPRGIPSVDAEPAFDALSEREIEVLHLVALGLSNRELAERLFLAEGTIKRHIHNINEKLGAGNRTQAVARGRELGLI